MTEVKFTEGALGGIKALDRPQDIAALRAARDELQANPTAGVLGVEEHRSGNRRLYSP